MQHDAIASIEQGFPAPDALTKALKMGLPEFGWISWVSRTGSTNTDLIQRARAPSRAPSFQQDQVTESFHASPTPWLLGAHLQTAGKGRAGRPWQNVAGECLMFSCAFEPQIPLAQLPGIAPALGVATCLALRSLLGNPAQLKLKWPNDLQWEAAKLAGLLIETAPAFLASASSKEHTGSAASTLLSKHHPMIVVGMGLNLTGAEALSAHLQRPITDLSQILQSVGSQRSGSQRLELQSSERDHPLTPSILVTHIARAWQQALVDYKDKSYAAFTQGFDLVDALAGQRVQVVDQGKVLHEGLAQGTDTQGRLVIVTKAGVFPVLVGDVSIRPKVPMTNNDNTKGPQ